ncbi:MAG: glycosyltransferase family 1 protein [Dehalococcoidia bacterium]|nr:glycosyltransferase family 1 protein [Dehalococcoidia bacterium]MSQ17649.1 glycosyltransferase family 1 protein [Dehalococcoidia bacterium]
MGLQVSSPPLRVLFLTPYFRPYLGGIERAIEQLSFQLMQSPSVEAVAVLTTKYAFPRIPHPEWADRETTPQGIAIFRLAGHPEKSLPLYSVPLVWFSPGQIQRYVQEFNPNVVHFVGDGWFWGHFWAWFWLRGRARFVFTPSFHTLPPHRWWLRPINGFLCGRAHHVVSLSRNEAEQVRRAYWTPRRKQRVIGWGASLPGGIRPGPPLQRGDGGISVSAPLTILCVGRLGAHKGQMWLLEVYRRARPHFLHPTRLVLVGRDEGGAAELRAAIGEAGLAGEVVLTGEVSDADLADWYLRSDLFALFSRYEAFGLAFFEAMSCGVPVLTHAVGANLELLSQGAVVTPRFDAPAAVEHLVRLVNDDALRQRLGQQGQEYVRARFTWPEVARQYLELYSG